MAAEKLSITYAAYAVSSGNWDTENNEVYSGKSESYVFYTKFAFQTPAALSKSKTLTLGVTTSQNSNPLANTAFLSEVDMTSDQVASMESYIASSAPVGGSTATSAGTEITFTFETDALKANTTYYLYIKRTNTAYNGFFAMYNPLYGEQSNKAYVLLDYLKGAGRIYTGESYHTAIPHVYTNGSWKMAAPTLYSSGVWHTGG